VASVESIVQLSVGITTTFLKCAFEETPPINLVLSAIEIAKSTLMFSKPARMSLSTPLKRSYK
jgi:hypothetical protein